VSSVRNVQIDGEKGSLRAGPASQTRRPRTKKERSTVHGSTAAYASLTIPPERSQSLSDDRFWRLADMRRAPRAPQYVSFRG